MQPAQVNPVMRPILLALALLLLVACSSSDDGPPVIAPLPEFALVDQDGRAFGLDQMRGHPTVVGFIFTSCRSICPTLTARMRRFQEQYPTAHFVSFSVDPEADTPAVLKEYAARFGADLSRWRFVTGDTAEVNRTVVRGFRVAMGERVDAPEGYDIMHSSHLVLVDGDGAIRGYYATDDEAMARLERDLARLSPLEGS